MKKRIKVKKIEKTELIINDSINIASFYNKKDLSIGELGKKYSGYIIHANLKEKAMNEDPEVAIYFPIYANLDKFEDLNDLFFEAFLKRDSFNNWDNGIVGYMILKKEFLKEHLNYKRVSRNKKCSKKRKREILEFMKSDLYELKKYFCMSLEVSVENEMNETKVIGEIFAKKDFEEINVLNSIKENLISQNLISANDIDNYEIELDEELKNYIYFLKQNFSWNV